MKWSQLKIRVEALFADSIKGRVELRTTRYNRAHDQMGRGWITLDKHEVINMCDSKFQMEQGRESTKIRTATGNVDYRNPDHIPGYYDALDQANDTLRSRSVYSRREFVHSLSEYLNLSVDEVLACEDPIIRAIGMLDRRVGKKRIAAMKLADQPAIVRRLHEIRCKADGLDTPPSRLSRG